MDVVRVEGQRLSLYRVRHLAVQHPDAAYLGVECDAHDAERVVWGGGHLTRTPGAVTVRVGEVISRVGVTVIIVDVSGGERVIVPDQVWMILLYTVIQNGDGHPESRVALIPGALHHHVEVIPSVQIPHVAPHWIIDLRPRLKCSSLIQKIQSEF